jgi:glycerate-2-kinase
LWDVLWGADVDASFAALDAAGLAVVDRNTHAEALRLLRRYRAETPLGHQPHMIAHEADAMLAAAAKGGER